MRVETLNKFGLTYQQTKALFMMQYDLTHSDILHEKNIEKQKTKQVWLNKWKDSINTFLSRLEGAEEKPNISTSYMLKKNPLLDRELDALRQEAGANKLPLYLMLLEATLFEPYFPLEVGHNKEVLLDRLKDKMRRTKADKKIIKGKLYHFANMLSINESDIDSFIKSYDKAVDGLTGKKMKIAGGVIIGTVILVITAGYGAPAIAAKFAPAGLYGAAAVSSGMAALGGGAIATGGLGIPGGMAVIVGGGALVGAGVGATAGAGANAIMKASGKFALTEAAKLEVVMKEILLTKQKDVRFVQELIREQRMAISNLEDELLKMKLERKDQKEEIKNLEEAISYLKKALIRSQNLIEGTH